MRATSASTDDVAMNGGGRDAGLFLQCRGGLRQRGLVPIGQDDAAAFPHDRRRNGAAEPAGAAGHQCGSILQQHSIIPSVQA